MTSSVPQDIAFALPYPASEVADQESSRRSNLAWCRRFGLLRSDEAVERYLYSGVAELAAFAYPYAQGEDMDLAYDVIGLFFLLDDQFDVPAGRHPRQTVAACEELIALAHHLPDRPDPEAPPIVAAFADVLRRTAEGMSPAWARRTGRDWSDYFAGNLTEVFDRSAGQTLDLQGYLALGHKTIGVRPSLALGERVGHCEVPAAVWHTSLLESLRRLTAEHILLVNNVFSLEKEERRGEECLVHILMREKGYSRAEAIHAIRRWADDTVQRFETRRAEIPSVCAALGLTGTEAESVDRYVVAMQAWIRGDYDWHLQAGRYSSQAITDASQPGYLNVEDLVTRPAGAVTGDDQV